MDENMIPVITPMYALVNTKEQLEKMAKANPEIQDKKLEGYLQALEDVFNTLKEYF